MMMHMAPVLLHNHLKGKRKHHKTCHVHVQCLSALSVAGQGVELTLWGERKNTREWQEDVL
jgi:hypothetical protein